MSIEENIPLSPLTTFRIGGPSRYFVVVHSKEEIAEALLFARKHSLPVFILGGGSNVLIADKGWNGLTIALRLPGITEVRHPDKADVIVGAGEDLDTLVSWTVAQGYRGIECLSGIPGTVGGAVVANAGAYGQQVSDVLTEVEIFDHESMSVRTLSNAECLFAYHDSVFGKKPSHSIVLKARLLFPLSGAPQSFYKDNRFDVAALAKKKGETPTLDDVREAILNIREEKGNLIMEGRPSFKGAGSFFHLPFISESHFKEVEHRARALDREKEEELRPWAWRQENGMYKIAAGFLLEYTEFCKGYTRGAVGISPKHTLAIINRDGATAAEVALLARDMQDAVARIFDIHLEQEVEYVGFS